jgi:CheY-like chemotaxis protein
MESFIKKYTSLELTVYKKENIDEANALLSRLIKEFEGIVADRGAIMAAKSSSPVRVLVVDDNAFDRQGLVRFLIRSGYEVVTAENGKDALAQLPGEKIDLIITDFQMPEMDGLDLLDQIKRGNLFQGPIVLNTNMSEAITRGAAAKRNLSPILEGVQIIGKSREEMASSLESLKKAGLLPANSSPTADGKDVGGINLDPSLLNLQIKRDKNWVPLPMDQQPPIENMNIEGFYPVIINVTPLPSLPILLGLEDGVAPDSAGKENTAAPSGQQKLSLRELSPAEHKARERDIIRIFTLPQSLPSSKGRDERKLG